MCITRKINKHDDKLFSWGIALLCCTIVFIVIEIKYPFFFLRDDNADSFIADYMYGIRCMSEGKFPFYCFNEFGGQRFFAAGQTGLLNPLVIFSADLSLLVCGKPDLLIDILAYISIILGCTGSFFLIKKLGCSDLSAIVGSIAWVFNAYNIWEGTSWLIVVYTTSVFPFFLLTSLILLEKNSIRNYFFAIIPRVYLFYLGHPQFFIFASVFDCIFTGVLCLLMNKQRWHKLLTLIRDYLFVYVSTTFLVLPLLIPEYQYTLLTNGYDSARTYENLLLEMDFEKPAFYFPFLYTEETYKLFYPPFIGFLLMSFLFAGLLLLFFLHLKKPEGKLKKLEITMFATVPCIVLSYLILFSRDAIRIIS